MSKEDEAIDKPASGALRRGKGLLKMLAMLLLIAAASAWIALGIGLYMDVGRGTRVLLVILAALGTEALFWVVAALLGVSVIDARRRIWRWITGRRA